MKCSLFVFESRYFQNFHPFGPFTILELTVRIALSAPFPTDNNSPLIFILDLLELDLSN